MNGNIQYAPDNTSNYDLGTVATYSCIDGFVLDFSTPGSAPTRTCIDDNDNDAEGVFDRQAPECVCKCICMRVNNGVHICFSHICAFQNFCNCSHM